MTDFGAADIPAMLAGFGQTATLGAVTVAAVVDTVDDAQLEREGVAVIGANTVVRIETDSLSGLAVGSEITAEGVDYVVRDMRRIGDGAFTKLYCAVVAEP